MMKSLNKILRPTFQQQQPLGCDTFVAFPPATSTANTVIFGKNSDRPRGEPQSIRTYPALEYRDDEQTSVECTYLSIPQVSKTHGVLLSQIDWMWGAEMGANDAGVVIGNEAVWTVEPYEDDEPSLLGMDLVRLGLERGSTARESLDVITDLLEKHGQGGACAENDPSFTYHNSFLIASAKEAYILETAGRHWVAERIEKGTRNISNNLTIRTNYDLHSKNLLEHARKKGYWDGKGRLDFAAAFSEGGAEELEGSRQHCGECLMKAKRDGCFTPETMMEILRDHESGICMHGGFETTSSMVSELHSSSSPCRHWMTGKPHPCKTPFLLQEF